MGPTRHPDHTTLLAHEVGGLQPEGDLRVALLYPNSYAVAMASLGFQAVWARLNAIPNVACERVVWSPDEPPAGVLKSLETGRPLDQFELIAVSISDELDLGNLALALRDGRVAPLRSERDELAPPVVAGGPLTQSNPRPLAAFADVVVNGDSEGLLDALVRPAETAPNRASYLAELDSLEGLYIPARDGDDPPPARHAVQADRPAYSQVWTPYSALPDMFLVEVSRGCSRRCAFCLSASTDTPERRFDREAIWERVPAEAPRVGFVGAAVTDHPALRELLARTVARGQGVGVSSLRADRLDGELVRLLVEGGMRTLTVASDATSERLRRSIRKGISEDHLRHAAELAREHFAGSLKLYVIVGLPDETDEDVEECIALCRELATRVRLVVNVNPFVPKLGTPLAGAVMASQATLEARIRRLRRGLGGAATVRALSPRWAWVQWLLSRGGEAEGVAACRAALAGGRFADWKRALAEREAS